MAINKKKENEVSAVLTPIRSNTGYSGQSTTGQKTTLPSAQNLPFTSQLTQKKNAALDAYLNRGDFKYDFNADALYQHYKDAYVRQGQQAMQDTMGQAAALTGGYGSSYAQNVGQQAYNAQLQNLNDVIPELYRMAYDRYQNEGQGLLQRYGLLADAESQEYDRWYQANRDAVSDKQWADSFQYQKDRDVVSDSQWQQSFDYQKDRDAVADSQWQQSFDYQKGRDAVSDSQWQQSFDYQKYQDAAAAEAESSKVTKEAAEAMAMHGDYSGWAAYLGGVPYETAKQHYIATYGDPTAEEPIEKPIFSRRDDETGLYHYYLDGKEVKFEQFVNPLTGKANPDAVGKDKDGNYRVFLDANGNPTYQPNNIDGDPLTEAGWTDVINGHKQNVWEAKDGSLWMWDDTVNKYVSYVENSPEYELVETENMEKFRKTIDKSMFTYDGKFSEADYKKQVATTIDVWLSKGWLDNQEAASLMIEYQLDTQ